MESVAEKAESYTVAERKNQCWNGDYHYVQYRTNIEVGCSVRSYTVMVLA